MRKVVLLVIYLFNYDYSKSTFFMLSKETLIGFLVLNMALDVVLSTVFVK